MTITCAILSLKVTQLISTFYISNILKQVTFMCAIFILQNRTCISNVIHQQQYFLTKPILVYCLNSACANLLWNTQVHNYHLISFQHERLYILFHKRLHVTYKFSNTIYMYICTQLDVQLYTVHVLQLYVFMANAVWRIAMAIAYD